MCNGLTVLAGARGGGAGPGATLSQSEVTTDASGRATFAVTAPSASALGNTITVSATPVGTNAERAIARTVTISLTGPSNTTAPKPDFDHTPTDPEENALVSFDASKTTDEGNVACLDLCTYNWNFGDGSTASGRITPRRFSKPGTYTVTLTVTDNAGSITSKAKSLTVSDVSAPTVKITVVPDPPVATQAATFTAEATSAKGHGITEYKWIFGDGKSQITSSPTTTHEYAVIGTYIATVTVKDDLDQSASASKNFTIVSSGLTAEFTFLPSEPTTTNTVQFDGSKSTAFGGATITKWAWDFDDGTTVEAAVPTASRQFGIARTYVVRLTVTDSAGRSHTTTKEVKVK